MYVIFHTYFFPANILLPKVNCDDVAAATPASVTVTDNRPSATVQSCQNIVLSGSQYSQSDVWRLAGDDLAAAMYLAGITQVPK